MPSYRGHLIGGMLTYLTVLHLVKYSQPTVHVVIQGLLFCLLGSLFPDVDVKSKGQKIFYVLLLAFLIYCLAMQRWDMFISVSLLGTIPLLVKHRGIFHELWFLLCLTLLMIICTKSFYKQYEGLFMANSLFFFAGCLSHIILDRVGSRFKRYFS